MLKHEKMELEKLMYSMDDASKLTGLSKSCLYKLTANRMVSFYKPFGKMIFFSKDQLMNLLTKVRVKSMDELKEELDSVGIPENNIGENKLLTVSRNRFSKKNENGK